jgi:hypothetical protein
VLCHANVASMSARPIRRKQLVKRDDSAVAGFSRTTVHARYVQLYGDAPFLAMAQKGVQVVPQGRYYACLSRAQPMAKVLVLLLPLFCKLFPFGLLFGGVMLWIDPSKFREALQTVGVKIEENSVCDWFRRAIWHDPSDNLRSLDL